MVVVIVRWYIKNGKEEEFKNTWVNMKPKTDDGLFREFFSKPLEIIDDKYHTLDIESRHYATYINVGVWDKIESFNEAIGSMIPGRTSHYNQELKNKELIEVFDFEFKLRERIVMNVEDTRGGKWSLPPASF